jgi:hypothetical protein
MSYENEIMRIAIRILQAKEAELREPIGDKIPLSHLKELQERSIEKAERIRAAWVIINFYIGSY